MILDSGNRVPMGDTGFVRDCKEGVGRMDLLPWRAIIEVSKHCEEGAKKYGERNIDKGCPQHSLIDSAFRHLAKYTVGMTDEDHLRACAWNILWALEQEVCRPDMQDIPARMEESEEHLIAMTLDGQEIKIPTERYSPKKYIHERAMENCRIDVHTPNPGGWEKIGEEKDPSKYDHAVEEPHHSINPERRCVEMTCYYNTEGFCQSVTDLWNPDLGEQCPDFSED